MHGGQQMLPDLVQHGLHVLHATDHGQHRVLLWHDDTELTEGTVTAIGIVLAAPELIAIADHPIGVGLSVAIVGSGLCCISDPFLWYEALALPQSILQIHLTKAGDLLR